MPDRNPKQTAYSEGWLTDPVGRVRHMTRRQTAKTVFFFIVLAVAIWAFWPSKEGGTGINVRTGSAEDGNREVRFDLEIVPGNFYMPGTIPMGIGDPLTGFKDVAAEFEKLYPDTRITLRSVPGVREWLVTQLASEQAPDIVNVNVEDVWQDTQKGWYIPLDRYLEQPNPLVKEGEPGSSQWWDMFKYQAVTRGKAAPDGRQYCLSLDMVETGIYYNKDMFREIGVEVPETWAEFIEIQKKIKAAGKVPFLTVTGPLGDWGVDLVFDQLYYEILPGIDLVQDPVREQYLEGYLDYDEICFLHSKGFFTRRDPRYTALWKTLKDWRQYWNKDLSATDRMRLFVNQEGAMMWEGSWCVQKLARDPEIDFDWGVFYLPPITKETCKYACGVDMCVIGGVAMQYEVTNSAISDTGDPETSERLQRVIQFLQFLTLPRNTDRVVNETLAFLPNIVGVPVHPELQPFDDILRRRYTTTKWIFTFDLRFNEIQNRMLELYLNDGLTFDEFMDWIENNLDQAIATIERRKHLDFTEIEKRWNELAPVRAGMEGLPEPLSEAPVGQTAAGGSG